MTRLMMERAFVPNTPCLVNAGKAEGAAGGLFRAAGAGFA
jgi:ribonucleotide reductase alpha subunit